MAIRAVELSVLVEIFKMEGGYVLDFTNKEFTNFFVNELRFDRYAHELAKTKPSKGQRLRWFFANADDVSIARAISALWEYRESKRIAADEPETAKHARARLSRIVERLGGAPLPDFEPSEAEVPPDVPTAEPVGPKTAETQALTDLLMDVHRLAPQPRGYAFETFLQRLFNAWQFDAREGFKLVGEQIDGSFVLDNEIYLLEAKWQNPPVDKGALLKFQGTVAERPQWTRGLFVSFNGFSNEALASFRPKNIVLMNGADIVDLLGRRLPLPDVLREKLRHGVERGEGFAPTRDLFP